MPDNEGENKDILKQFKLNTNNNTTDTMAII